MSPLYDFQCDRCGHLAEVFFPVAECPESMPCSCGGTKGKIISFGHGGVLRDEPAWLDANVREVLQDSDRVRAGLEAPITDRCAYRRHLKEHGITER